MSETGKMNHSFPSAFSANLVRSVRSTLLIQTLTREENRRQEILELIAAGKIPHSVEIDKHPEKSLQGRMCKFSRDPCVDS